VNKRYGLLDVVLGAILADLVSLGSVGRDAHMVCSSNGEYYGRLPGTRLQRVRRGFEAGSKEPQYVRRNRPVRGPSIRPRVKVRLLQDQCLNLIHHFASTLPRAPAGEVGSYTSGFRSGQAARLTEATASRIDRAKIGPGRPRLALSRFNPWSIDPENVGNTTLLEHLEPDAGAAPDIDDAFGFEALDEQGHDDLGGTPTPVAMLVEELGVVDRG
jgi:hypothetical protein